MNLTEHAINLALTAPPLTPEQIEAAARILATVEPEDVACRLAAAVPAGPVVYYAWDADGELLYVGSSVNVSQRIRAHSTGTHWWSEVARLTFDEFETEPEARRAESRAIYNSPGVYNQDSRRGRYAQNEDILKLVSGDRR